MRLQISLTTEYIKQGSIQQLIIISTRIILNNDILQFRKLGIYLIMMTGKYTDIILTDARLSRAALHK